MGVIYRYLSSFLGPLQDDYPAATTTTTSASTTSSSPLDEAKSRLTRQMYRLFPMSSEDKTPYKRSEDLSLTCVTSHDLLFNSILLAVHYETVWWIRLNVSNYYHRRNRSLILPRVDFDSIVNVMEWKLYWQRFKARVGPAVFEYQTTLSIMYFFQTLVGMMVSPQILFRLTQNPYLRAKVVASESDNRFAVAVGTDSFVTCLWGNAFFFAASYTFGQLMILYNYYHHGCYGTTPSSSSSTSPSSQTEADRRMILSSWRLLTTIVRRYYSSALGASIGSIIWPGVGTMVGMGLGDGIGELTPEPSLPNWDLRRLWSKILKHTTILLGGKGDEAKDNYYNMINDRISHRAYQYRRDKDVDDELTCGCCQIVLFSSNPRCPERAPVSSRECSHTICKRCVEQCHLALMERIHVYHEWISCPICKATNAFSSHNHLINRSLCNAIALMETQQTLFEQQLQQMEQKKAEQEKEYGQQSRTKSPPTI